MWNMFIKRLVPGTHRQCLQGEQIVRPVCKSDHASTALDMHSIWSASGHKLSHIHHSVVSKASKARTIQSPSVVWQSVYICMNLHVIHLNVHLYSQKPGQHNGPVADASSGSGVCFTQCLKGCMCKMAQFALACWLCSMQMESMYSGAERCSTSSIA